MSVFEAEQRQFTLSGWVNLNLDRLIEEAKQDVFKAAGMPSGVVLLLDDERVGGCTPRVSALIQQRLSALRNMVDQGHEKFALGNQPQYVVDRVMAHTVPEGWKPGQYRIGDLP